jgi:hypothetical protein
VDYNKEENIKEYIGKKGFNYNEIENIKFLAKGGQSLVLRLEVKQPVEVIAKIVLPS